MTAAKTTKRVSLYNMSDEYQTANEETFSTTSNNTVNNSLIQQNIHTVNNVLPGGQSGIATSATTMAARKQMTPVDQAEPAKPLSAYALFFRDTVSAIKQQNPTCSFHELSKIVASMWDALDPVHKGVYNKKNEQARTEYLKQVRIYQQQQLMKQEQLNANANERLQTETNVQQLLQPSTNNINVQQNTKVVNNNTATANNVITATTAKANSAAPFDGQISLLTEAGSVQKCTRDNCNKRAIINPDWEDEYCSNECVITHCRNVFNAWVQSNLEAKQQQQTHQPAQQSPT